VSGASSVAPQLRAQLLRAWFTPDLANASPHAVSIALTVAIVNAAQPSVWQDTEITATDYARVTLPLTSLYWEMSSTDTILNISQIAFPPPQTSWGLVAGWAMVAGDGSNTLYACGQLQSTSVYEGAPAPTIPALGIGIRLYD
jgi:hypothetical protein